MAFNNDYDYFNDINYSDYRELICFERPISVLLHYDYDIQFSRVFLFDRFDFEWNGQELVNNSNALDDFYKESKVVSYLYSKLEDLDDFKQFLAKELENDNHALLLPYYSLFGDVKISSTVMVEKHSGIYVSTSLRGDKFYIRKELNVEEFYEVLYVENNQLEFWKFDLKEDFIKDNRLSLEKAVEAYDISNQFHNKLSNFKNNKNKFKGAKGLLLSFNELKQDYSYWNDLVQEGMSNALMVKFFWPIQFYYKPFLVFLSYMDRNSQLGLVQSDQDKLSQLSELIKYIDKRTANLNNLAILFGKRPSERRFLEFQKIFEEILNTYQDIEDLLHE